MSEEKGEGAQQDVAMFWDFGQVLMFETGGRTGNVRSSSRPSLTRTIFTITIEIVFMRWFAPLCNAWRIFAGAARWTLHVCNSPRNATEMRQSMSNDVFDNCDGKKEKKYEKLKAQ